MARCDGVARQDGADAMGRTATVGPRD